MTTRSRHRVAVTGLGAVSSLGIGSAEFTEGIKEGRSGIRPISTFDTAGFPCVLGGEVPEFDATAYLHRLDARRLGRSSLFAATAARLAVTDSNLDQDELCAAQAGVAIGTTNGEAAVVQSLTQQLVAHGPSAVDRRLITRAPANNIANSVSIELGLSGESFTMPTACAASNYAIGFAFDMVCTGDADIMLAGGADSINRQNHAGFYRLGALADDTCRPFDVQRNGIITAEGGAVLLLENMDHAVHRGARIYGEMLGYGLNCDARHMVHPDPVRIAECIALAHADAGVTPEQIDYICAHGTGTPTNDATEVQAIRQIFRDRLPPISSIKSMIGHTMGAASGFGALICLKALEQQFLPPTATVESVDPRLGPGLDCVPGRARLATLNVVQNHGFAFGGNNAITLFGRLERPR